MKDMVIEIFGSKPEQNAVEACAKAFAAYSLYGWIEVWFPRGMQESADELTERRIRSKRETVSVWVNCLTKECCMVGSASRALFSQDPEKECSS